MRLWRRRKRVTIAIKSPRMPCQLIRSEGPIRSRLLASTTSLLATPCLPQRPPPKGQLTRQARYNRYRCRVICRLLPLDTQSCRILRTWDCRFFRNRRSRGAALQWQARVRDRPLTTSQRAGLATWTPRLRSASLAQRHMTVT